MDNAETNQGPDAEPQHDVEARLQRIRAIAEQCAAELREAGPPIDHAELLYDEWGLPE